MTELRAQAILARQAALELATTGTQCKNDALRAMAHELRENMDQIIAANEADIASARERGLGNAFIERLTLDGARVEAMGLRMESVAALDDPVGRVDEAWVRPNGLRIAKRRVPLGVIGIIYESRPNVTSDAVALCLKSGNAVLLRGGSDSINSNREIEARADRRSTRRRPARGCVSLVKDTSHERPQR